MANSDRRRPVPGRRTYVLDTSVLLADPRAMVRFDEHEVVLPVVVITELEAKRTTPSWDISPGRRCGYSTSSGSCTASSMLPIPLGDSGGTLHVELNHTDPAVLPPGFRLGDNDTRILAVARNLAADGHDVVLVSKDLPLRVKASAVGLAAEEYRAETVIESGWTGMTELDVAAEVLDRLYDGDHVDLTRPRAALPHRPGARLRAGHGLGRVTRGQDGPAGPRRSRGVRPARPQRRAAGRARPPARS